MTVKNGLRLTAVLLCAFVLLLTLGGCKILPGLGIEPGKKKTETQDASLTENTTDTAETIETTETETDKAITKGEEQLSDFRKTLSESGSIAGVCFMGYTENSDSDAGKLYGEDYPMVSEIPAERRIICEGSEYYCIVPADDSIAVKVCQWYFDENDDYTPKAGKVLYESRTGESVLIRCNAIEGIPNIIVTVSSAGGEYQEFNPQRSLENGKVLLPQSEPFVADLTDYSKADPSANAD
ncbi:MAG: hypothetical protein ACI3YE_03275 [Candidatus Avispirillum sp.]